MGQTLRKTLRISDKNDEAKLLEADLDPDPDTSEKGQQNTKH